MALECWKVRCSQFKINFIIARLGFLTPNHELCLGHKSLVITVATTRVDFLFMPVSGSKLLDVLLLFRAHSGSVSIS